MTLGGDGKRGVLGDTASITAFTSSNMTAQQPMFNAAASDDVSKGPSLLDLPPEVLLQGLFPVLPLKDLLNISLVNKELHSLAVRPVHSS